MEPGWRERGAMVRSRGEKEAREWEDDKMAGPSFLRETDTYNKTPDEVPF